MLSLSWLYCGLPTLGQVVLALLYLIASNVEERKAYHTTSSEPLQDYS
jgi:hypothetical protein